MADKLDDGGNAFIKPTTHFWQDILAADDAAVPGGLLKTTADSTSVD